LITIARIAPQYSTPILQNPHIKFKRILSKKIKVPALETTGTHLDLSALLPVSPSYYDRRFPAAAKADAGKARTPILKNYGINYFEKTT